MQAVRLRDIQRFKKTRAGLIEFACILEQSPPKVREKILEEVGQLDPSFLRMALRKVVYFEELVFLDESCLAEILTQASPKILAFALTHSEESFKTKIMGTLGYRKMRQVMDEQEKMGTPDSNEVLGAQIQVLKIGRELEAKNKFIFELLDCPRFKRATPRKHLRLVDKK